MRLRAVWGVQPSSLVTCGEYVLVGGGGAGDLGHTSKVDAPVFLKHARADGFFALRAEVRRDAMLHNV